MFGYYHRHGCSGWHHWRGPDPEYLEERGLRYVGPCRCGHGPHAYYVTRDGRTVYPYEAVGEIDKPDRIAFLEDEVRSLKEYLERSTRELEKLKEEKAKGT